MDIHTTIAERIIREQEVIIGPVAWDEARKVSGVTIPRGSKRITLDPLNPASTIDQLVRQYERLFGQTSVEVCKDAVKDLVADLPKDQRPALLISAV